MLVLTFQERLFNIETYPKQVSLEELVVVVDPCNQLYDALAQVKQHMDYFNQLQLQNGSATRLDLTLKHVTHLPDEGRIDLNELLTEFKAVLLTRDWVNKYNVVALEDTFAIKWPEKRSFLFNGEKSNDRE